MYSGLSEIYLQRMKMPACIKRITGTLDSTSITGKNIVKNSARITNKCSDNSEVQIGQVYIGQLNLTLKNISIPWKQLKGKEIVLYEGLYIDMSALRQSNYWVDVKLGHFTIDDALSTVDGFECIAYDNMAKFDTPINLGNTVGGTICALTNIACTACGVTFGMTQSQVQALPNGQEIFDIYGENDLETWRDLISWCAQSMGANALINRDGELIYKCYSDSTISSNIVETFVAKDRIGSSARCSSFETFYTGLSIMDMKNSETVYYDLNPNNGLTMDLGSNPLLQDNSMETKCRRILDKISVINYTPFTGMILHRPYIYDLMDVVEFTGGIIGEGVDVIGCITSIEWTLLGGLKIQGAGANPALAKARSKTDKKVVGIEKKIDEVVDPDINDIKSDIIDINDDISDISRDISDISSSITDITGNISDITDSVESLSSSISDISSVVEDLGIDVSGKQSQIDFSNSAPSTGGSAGDITFANGKMYTNDGTGWTEYPLSAAADIIHISNVDIGVGAQLETGHVYLVYE